MAKNDKQREGGLVFSTDRTLLDSLQTLLPKETLPKEKQPLRVYKDLHKRKGKVVTIVEGFDGAAEDLKELAKELKIRCGVGGTAKDGLIILQGEHLESTIQTLIEQGYTRTRKRS